MAHYSNDTADELVGEGIESLVERMRSSIHNAEEMEIKYDTQQPRIDIVTTQPPSIANDKLSIGHDQQNIFAAYFYDIESFIIRNTRLYSFCLLCVTLWPRAIIILDMYTDYLVAIDLYHSAATVKGSALLFMLTCLFISFSFLMVWTASLRFVHKYQQQQQSKFMKTVCNIFLIIYLIPPIGVIFVAIFELCWVVYDMCRGMYYFVTGSIMIVNADPDIRTIVRYRKVVEFLCESFPQLILQMYIVFNGSDYVNATSLTISICVSAGSLIYNLGTLYFESKIHGMSTAEYALALLQLSEIPTIKLVPRLPAIRNGETDLCNFTYFRVDKESLGPIIDALSDTKCKLKKLKLSIHSLSDLTDKALRMLGSFLHSKQIQVIISQVAHPQLLLTLFQRLDLDKKGYLKFDEFKQLLSFTFHDEKLQKTIFQHLALRRLEAKDRVYFYDFYESIAGYRSKLIEYDFSIIRYPIHFIFKYITKMFQSTHTSCKDNVTDLLIAFDIDRYGLDASSATASNWKHVFDRLLNVYWFSIGFGYDTQLDEIGNNILFTIADAFITIQDIITERDQSTIAHLIDGFVWKLTLHLFADTEAMKTVHKLNHNQQHILLYCVQHKRWKLFAHVVNYVDDYFILEEISRNIDLPTMFHHAITDNLEGTVKYFTTKYPLHKLLSKSGKLTSTALIIYALFNNHIFQARRPSISMIKIFLNQEQPELFHEIMVGKYNLIRLAMLWRDKTQTAIQHTLSNGNVKASDSAFSTIEHWCWMNALGVDEAAWNTMFRDELIKYQNWLLDIIEFFTKQNSLLWIDTYSVDDQHSMSTTSFALDMQDQNALLAMVKSIGSAHAHTILNYPHGMYEDKNLFSLCLERKWYAVLCIITQHYLEIIGFNDTLDHPVFVLIQQYERYVTRPELASVKALSEQDATYVCCIMERIATRSGVRHVALTMNDDLLKETYNILVHLAGRKTDKRHTLSQEKYELLLNEFGDMRITRDIRLNSTPRRTRTGGIPNLSDIYNMSDIEDIDL